MDPWQDISKVEKRKSAALAHNDGGGLLGDAG
jgi:hypothetical protein